jgi:uncharacterized protein YndB with AHSA1/START domain
MSSTADREFVHSRVIDAPRERVFRAFSEPAHLARWWGPEGFTSTFELFEPKPGGTWRFVLHGPDGSNYPNHNVLSEYLPPRRVVVEHVSYDHHFLLTISFDELGTRTLVGWRQVFDTAEQREELAAIVPRANEQNLDRLAAEVKRMGSGAQLDGSCLCGGVRYAIDGPLPGAGNCHCSRCRKSHGAAFASWTFVAPAQFRWTEGENLLTRYASSPGLERLFCSRCGSPLAVAHDGEIREVVLASIDGDPGVRPGEHIFTGSKAPWHQITDTLPQHIEWPPGMGPCAST